MGDVSYIYYLSPADYIIIEFFTKGKEVKSFVVNYVSLIHDNQVTIRRYDNRHGRPHLDKFTDSIFIKTGKNKFKFKKSSQVKKWLSGDEGKIMRQGRDDIIKNWSKYKQEYTRSIIYK